MMKTQKSTTKYNTVVNPETGKRITLGGNIYKRLVAEGKVTKPGTLPDITEFVYLPDEDIWVRNKGPRFEGLMKNGYILSEKERKIVKKTVYNTKSKEEKDNNTKIDTKAWKMIMNVRDVLSLILSEACITETTRIGDLVTYMRIRATCKLFRDVLDRTAPYKSLLNTKLGVNTKHLDNKRVLKCLDKIPERVVKCYIETNTDLFVRNLSVKGGTKWFARLYKEEKYRVLLDESIQRVLSYYSGEKKPDYIQWKKIRHILARAKTIPNPDVVIEIWLDTNKFNGDKIDDRFVKKKFSEFWEIARGETKVKNTKDTEVVEIDE